MQQSNNWNKDDVRGKLLVEIVTSTTLPLLKEAIEEFLSTIVDTYQDPMKHIRVRHGSIQVGAPINGTWNYGCSNCGEFCCEHWMNGNIAGGSITNTWYAIIEYAHWEHGAFSND